MNYSRFIAQKSVVISALFTGGAIITLLLLPFTDLQSFSPLTPPYPPSKVITGVVFDWSTHDRRALGSDNWPITWAADDQQYTAWGDGGGFGGSNSDGRVSLGVARVEGDWDRYTGYNVWGGKDAEQDAQFEGKSYGILAVEGVLYMWVSPGSCAQNYTEARLALSQDYGATWTQADWAFTKEEDLLVPTFLQFGKAYTGARDDFVYSYFVNHAPGRGECLQIQKPGKIYLARVPKAQIMSQAAYQFFAGFDAKGQPTWRTGTDPAQRKPVFTNAQGVGWNLSVSYNAGLQRYLLITEHTQSLVGNFSLFDAPEPWGPWTTVDYSRQWGGFASTFYWNFANKWGSADGKEFTLIFTGFRLPYDSWNTVRGRFITTADPE
jgi:hypothetical protein